MERLDEEHVQTAPVEGNDEEQQQGDTAQVVAPGIYIVVLKTGKKVKLQELSGRQQRRADSATPQGCTEVVLAENRALFSVREIDGISVKIPATPQELDLLSDKFKGRELDELAVLWGRLFTDALEDQNAKNS